jgi:hypothetical protein
MGPLPQARIAQSFQGFQKRDAKAGYNRFVTE